MKVCITKKAIVVALMVGSLCLGTGEEANCILLQIPRPQGIVRFKSNGLVVYAASKWPGEFKHALYEGATKCVFHPNGTAKGTMHQRCDEECQFVGGTLI